MKDFVRRVARLEGKLSKSPRVDDIPQWQKEREKLSLILDKRNKGQELVQQEIEAIDRAYERAFKIIKILLDSGVTEILGDNGIGKMSIEYLRGIEKKEDLPFVMI
jgi:hypothetical protein